MGDVSKETAFDILDYFYDQGGNFIDTANGYQAEESETWLGEWLAKTGRRDEMVIATVGHVGACSSFSRSETWNGNGLLKKHICPIQHLPEIVYADSEISSRNIPQASRPTLGTKLCRQILAETLRKVFMSQ